MKRNDNLNKQFILKLTGITEDEYNNLILDSGSQLLESIIPNDIDGRKFLLESNDYWQWYIKSFKTRSHLFIQYLQTEIDDYFSLDVTHIVRERFYYAHSVAGIRSYQKRTPFYIIDAMYKRIINVNKEAIHA